MFTVSITVLGIIIVPRLDSNSLHSLRGHSNV